MEDVSLRKHARSASCGGDGVGGAPEGSYAKAPAFIPFEESSMPCEGVAGSSSEAQADGSRGRAGAPRSAGKFNNCVCTSLGGPTARVVAAAT